MINRRGLLILGLPLLALLGLVSAALMRRSSEPIPAARHHRTPGGDAAPAGEGKAQTPSVGNPQPQLLTRMPTAKDIGAAAANSRIQTTYTNFRIAVANNNQAVQRALLPLLQKDRETALWYARDNLAEATTEQDRTIALRTLKALEQ